MCECVDFYAVMCDVFFFFFAQDYTLVWHTGPLDVDSQSSCLYIQVPLSVVIKWDVATRQKLLMDAFTLNKQNESKQSHCIHALYRPEKWQ